MGIGKIGSRQNGSRRNGNTPLERRRHVTAIFMDIRSDFTRACVRPPSPTGPGNPLFSCDLGIMLLLHETYG